MRFNGEAYDKLFPRETQRQETVETAVETFKPTEQESNEEDNAVIDSSTNNNIDSSADNNIDVDNVGKEEEGE